METRPGTAGRRRWVVLFVGFFAMTAGCSMQYGMPYLIPALRAEGLGLAEAGLLVSAPVAGLLFTLVLWGAAADRWGERRVLGTGLTLAAAALASATLARDLVGLGASLACAGAAGASVHAASGRLVLGWFAAHERGLAMAVRQTAQPIGIAVAALALPVLGGSGLAPAFGFLAVLCFVAAVLVVLAVRDPARPAPGSASGAGAGSPYRTPVLWRIHGTSALLVVPQFAVATFGLAHLVDEQGWEAASAGRAFALAALGGAVARLLAGVWSDRVGSRLRPLRRVAVAIGAIMLLAGVTAGGDPLLASLTVLLAAVVTVSPNGLAYTAVAEHAGYTWAGRALGIQNTVQNAFAAAVPPVLGAVIGAVGYGHAFALVAAFPLLAVAVVPGASTRGAAGAAPPVAGPRPATEAVSPRSGRQLARGAGRATGGAGPGRGQRQGHSVSEQTPSQAEGEPADEQGPGRTRRPVGREDRPGHAEVPRTTPSQAEGERRDDDEEAGGAD